MIQLLRRSAIILEAIVTDDVDVPQYEVDSAGNRVKARDPLTYILGYVPKVDSYDEPITEKGIKIQWRYRVATADESLDSLEVASATGIYPIMAFEALGIGAYGDNLAFSLFYDPDQNSPSILDRFKSVFYSFEAAEKIRTQVPPRLFVVTMAQPYPSQVTKTQKILIPSIHTIWKLC